jgi:hypothetical protein
MWAYATCCMSQKEDDLGLELHMFSSKKDGRLIELLTATAHCHRTGQPLGLYDTINFGQSWQDNSECDFGFISLPYIDGPDLENTTYDNKIVKFYWVIPVTKAEVEFRKAIGADALEEVFEVKTFDYLNSKRSSVI